MYSSMQKNKDAYSKKDGDSSSIFQKTADPGHPANPAVPEKGGEQHPQVNYHSKGKAVASNPQKGTFLVNNVGVAGNLFGYKPTTNIFANENSSGTLFDP